MVTLPASLRTLLAQARAHLHSPQAQQEHTTWVIYDHPRLGPVHVGLQLRTNKAGLRLTLLVQHEGEVRDKLALGSPDSVLDGLNALEDGGLLEAIEACLRNLDELDSLHP